jgi:hypothetical protein
MPWPVGREANKMKIRSFCVVILLLTLVLVGGVEAQTPVIGQCPLPEWADDATTKLGWVFSDPQNPAGTTPLTGWDLHVGDPPAPVWDYDPTRLAWGMPGQWYIQIPNTEILDGFKQFWLCFVYERDPWYGGSYVFRNLDWTPFDREENVTQYEELFDATGVLTGDNYAGVYARMFYSADLYPCPQNEEIWLGIVGGGVPTPDGDAVWELLEVYLMAAPEDPTIFEDGFESGNTSAWSAAVGELP